MSDKELQFIDPNAYSEFFKSVKNRINHTRTTAIVNSNKLLIELYWWLGEYIVKNQEQHGWGKSIVQRLSFDLKQHFPNQQGFSPRNLWEIRKFYLEYKDEPKLQQLVAEIPWGQNLIIIGKIKEIEVREYYLKAVKEMGWTRSVLLHQIKASAYQRHITQEKQHNFQQALPAHLAEQASDTMKDIYLLDMLGMTEPFLESELENRMITKIKDVMLEFGYGFAFIGNQYRLAVEGREYFIDLLFFNRRLKCLVAVELKAGKYKPEYAGKMNFYLNLLNEYMKEPDENPAIGIILCSDRDRFEVEFSLKGIEKPVGVAEYHVAKKLPENLKGKLPDAKQLADRLQQEVELENAKASSE